jgi:hypothetical protein
MNTLKCRVCSKPVYAVSTWIAPVDAEYGWRINDADIFIHEPGDPGVTYICENGHEAADAATPFSTDGPPAFWESVEQAQALVQRAYDEAVEDGNPEVIGPLAEALEWLDGRRPLAE